MEEPISSRFWPFETVKNDQKRPKIGPNLTIWRGLVGVSRVGRGGALWLGSKVTTLESRVQLFRSISQNQGCTGSVRFGYGLGVEGFERFRFSVLAVPLQNGFFCVSVQFNREGRFRFRFRFLENGSGGSGSAFGFGKNGSDGSGFRFRFGS